MQSTDKELLKQFRENDRFITICKVGSKGEDPGREASPNIPKEIRAGRVGFSNVVVDEPRKIIRRHLLSMDVPEESISPCQSRLSLSLLLALRYLYEDGVEGEQNEQGNWQIEETIFSNLQPKSGGYQGVDTGGRQVLLNYRAFPRVAKTVTLSQVLVGEVDADLIADKLVIVGTTDRRFKDYHLTPLGEMAGVFIQGHMTSQILNAVLENRSLLWYLPTWGEFIWLGFWSLTGGLIVWSFRAWPKRLIGFVISGTAVYGSCYLFFIQGLWLKKVNRFCY